MRLATTGNATAWLEVRRWRDGADAGIAWTVPPGTSSQAVRRDQAGLSIEPGLVTNIMAVGVHPQSLYVVTVKEGKE